MIMKRYIKAVGLQPVKHRKYHIIDLDHNIFVEETTRKEVLSWLDEFLENLQYDWYQDDDTSFAILYSDGSSDFITQSDYDGHRIKRTGIFSMVYSNPENCVVFGPYEINQYGVVTPAFEMHIDDNIERVE